MATAGFPSVSPAKILEAVDKVLTYRLDIEYIAIVNNVEKAVLAGLGTLLERQATERHYYLWALTRREGVLAFGGNLNEYIQALEEDIKSTRSKRVACLAMEAVVLSRGVERVKVPLGLLAGFISSQPIKQSLNEVSNSPLPNFLGVFPANLEDSAQKDISDAGYLCFREFLGVSGIYLVEPRLTTDITSDFYRIERIRIANKASSLLRTTLLKYIGDD